MCYPKERGIEKGERRERLSRERGRGREGGEKRGRRREGDWAEGVEKGWRGKEEGRGREKMDRRLMFHVSC